MLVVDEKVSAAYRAAISVRERAHAPYSRFRVGAALSLAGVESFVVGCNVENATPAVGVCAERVAINQAVARFGRCQMDFLVVVADQDVETVPCGVCLQALAEFVPDEFPIYCGNLQGLLSRYLFKDLYPRAYRTYRGAKS